MSQYCRFCNSLLTHTFCDLGATPLSNSYLKSLDQKDPFFPLHAFVCGRCFLVQLGQFATPAAIFTDYAYFSSFSDSWLEHGRKYSEMVQKRFDIDSSKLVIEVASNDGYLLQHFKAKNIPILGIDPAKNVAQAAINKGIPTISDFFSQKLASSLNQKADFLIANNVLAHVPDINDFVSGLKILLRGSGILTVEFPHLLQLMRQNQFDTIYHEHFSYFSFLSAEKIFEKHGLEIFDVEELPTHGGSLRLFLQHPKGTISPRVEVLKQKELDAGLHQLNAYILFAKKVHEFKKDLLSFFEKLKREKKSIVGYGAPAKGNTLLNYCGITLPFTVDKNPHKQGKYLPGSHIPVYAPSKIDEFRPDFLLILPWNIKDEIMSQMAHIHNWGGQFVTLIPEIIIE